MRSMPKKFFLVLVPVLIVMTAGFFLVKILIKNIREEVKAELRKEIRQIVCAEIKNSRSEEKDFAEGGENVVSLNSPGTAKNSSDTRKPYSLGKENEGNDLVRNVREMVKRELDAVFAGQSETNTAVAGGYTKKVPSSQTDVSLDSPSGGPYPRDAVSEELEVRGGRERAIERTLTDKGGMLLPWRTLQIEPSFTTAHFSSNRINIQGFSILPVLVIGDISTESVKRDIFIEAVSLKYGILHNLQGEVKIPYRSEFDRVTSNTGAETTRSSDGLGDIELNLSRQIASEHGLIPDLILSLGCKTITGPDPYNRDIGLGTGHYASRVSLVGVKSSDPAVVFGSIGYTYNIKRKINDYGTVKPGDSISYSLGTAIALSYQTAINFQFEQSITSKMKKDGRFVNGSFMNAANFKAGFTWAISEKSSIDLAGGIGLTTDSPDYTFEIRFPYTF